MYGNADKSRLIDYVKWLFFVFAKWAECGAKAGFWVMLKDFEIGKKFSVSGSLFLSL